MPTASLQPMTQPQFTKLRKTIYDRTGIWFADNKQYLLESRLGARLEKLELDNYDQYFMLLSTGPFRDDEFQELCNSVTINETSFFRNEKQLEVFEQRVLSELIEKRKGVKRLRLWSAACSTGEEPFTLAIILKRTLGIRLMDWRIEILGTDLSERALTMARSGKFGSYAVRTTPEYTIKQYFRQENSHYVVDPDLHQMVHFERHNLKDRFAARAFGTFDVIFCRNVMIYFDEPMRQACLQMFRDQLAEDGTLFIGHSERVTDKALYQPRPEMGSFAYTRSL